MRWAYNSKLISSVFSIPLRIAQTGVVAIVGGAVAVDASKVARVVRVSLYANGSAMQLWICRRSIRARRLLVYSLSFMTAAATRLHYTYDVQISKSSTICRNAAGAHTYVYTQLPTKLKSFNKDSPSRSPPVVAVPDMVGRLSAPSYPQKHRKLGLGSSNKTWWS